MKILIFPCGTEIGLEYVRSLSFLPNVELYGLSSVADHGEMVVPTRCFAGDAPYVDDPGLVAYLNTRIREWGIDLVIPAHDSVVLALAEAREQELLAAPLLAPPLSVVRTCRSKIATHQALSGLVPLARIFKDAGEPSDEDFPLFLKPAVGQGSQGIAVAHTREMAREHLATHPDLMLLEMLPGEEYTVDCFSSRSGVLYAQARVRARIRNGISVRSFEAPKDVQLQATQLANSIHDALGCEGAWFFQLKCARDGSLRLLEVAPRIGGTSGYARLCGINLPLLWLHQWQGSEVHIAAGGLRDIVVDRALVSRVKLCRPITAVYVDLDDTLLLNGGQVRRELVGFLYHAHAAGKKIILLTRHAQDLKNTLKRARISELFDEIHHLPADKSISKGKYIRCTPALFIDDSFAERQAVAAEHPHDVMVLSPQQTEILDGLEL